MKIRGLRVVLGMALITVLAMGCRSEYERIRLSGHPEIQLAKALEYYEAKEYMRAQTLFELVLNQYRGRPESEEMFFKYAYTFYYQRQYTMSAHYFQNFAATFGYSEFKEEAEFLSAYSSYNMSPIFRLDQKPTIEALQGFQAFVNAYPTSDRVPECNKLMREMRLKLEEKAFANGKMYHDQKKYQAAIQSFENMLREFPESDRSELVQFMILESAYHYAVNSIFERRQERYKLALDKYRDFVKKYPSSQYRPDADELYKKGREQLKNLIK
ncbi:MAG: outer membrane protein assembly factor BamD [Bacteroidetes bacterium]|nr:MAG: outer membrane protein assembly factor BamD [Bacteroidota bacterium]